jgi:hypothetical protein
MQVGYVVFLGQHEPSNPMQLNVTTCNFSAQNTIDFYLTGYIWSSFKTWVSLPAVEGADGRRVETPLLGVLT